MYHRGRAGFEWECAMPYPETKLHALFLNGTLKHSDERSNTAEFAEWMTEVFNDHGLTWTTIRLSDFNLPPGIRQEESDLDQWHSIGDAIRGADIVVLLSPIWWGSHSSLIQRVIERLDSFDEAYRKSGVNLLYNKVGGVMVTGAEDGAMNIIGHLLMVLSYMGFTIPPDAGAFYVGRAGGAEDARADRLNNEASLLMARTLARNLVFYGQLLRNHPLEKETSDERDTTAPRGDGAPG